MFYLSPIQFNFLEIILYIKNLKKLLKKNPNVCENHLQKQKKVYKKTKKYLVVKQDYSIYCPNNTMSSKISYSVDFIQTLDCIAKRIQITQLYFSCSNNQNFSLFSSNSLSYTENFLYRKGDYYL